MSEPVLFHGSPLTRGHAYRTRISLRQPLVDLPDAERHTVERVVQACVRWETMQVVIDERGRGLLPLRFDVEFRAGPICDVLAALMAQDLIFVGLMYESATGLRVDVAHWQDEPPVPVTRTSPVDPWHLI